jgi:hypothetical protein
MRQNSKHARVGALGILASVVSAVLVIVARLAD